MRIAKVEIDNFLCFRHLSLTVDPDLQLLAGPNNSGKSSCVRLLEAFFSDLDGDDLMELQPAHEYFASAGPRILSAVTVWFTDLTSAERAACSSALRRDQHIWVAVRCGRAGRVTYAASRNLSVEDARGLYEYVLGQHHFVKIPSVRVGGPGDRDQPASLDRLLDTLEATLIRRHGRRGTQTQTAFAEKAAEFENVVRGVLDESAKSIHAELPFQEGEVRFRMPEFRYALRGMLEAAEIESVHGATVPVSERGTGFQSALVLGILRYVADQERQSGVNVVFAVEEPEAFLHPQTQRAMAAILRGIAEDAQVLVTTHSSVVVDSFKLAQIARLPLTSDGTEFWWEPPEMTEAEAGRLNRYCDAANSELVFASAVIFVEGEGDYQVLEHRLGRLCQTPGGHYARGVTVIEVGGKANFKHLVDLAENFGVSSFILADKDAVLPADRQLLKALRAREDRPSANRLAAIRAAADRPCVDYRVARRTQRAVNRLIGSHGAFVWSSDLEGVLVDAFGVDAVLGALGPDGEQHFDEQFVADVKADADPVGRLAAHLGSKRWDGRTPTSGKLKPHQPRLVFEEVLPEHADVPDEIAELDKWLQTILDHASTSAV
jgi:putative ATP-dependent endonuclease of OLD family